MTRRRDAWIEVDLEAIRENIRVIRGVVGPGVRVAPVVKADAYGHGLVPVAHALQPVVDALCVATLDEALTLRAAEVEGRIIVLYPVPPDAVHEAVDAGIELTVMSGRDAAAAASDRSEAASPIVTDSPAVAASPTPLAGRGYRTWIGPVIPPARRASASSRVATHRPSMPARTSAAATGVAPWP